jgi:hypothetical protein
MTDHDRSKKSRFLNIEIPRYEEVKKIFLGKTMPHE